MRSCTWLVVWALAVTSSACVGSGTRGGACGATDPTSCPATAPSYQTDVAPLLTAYCTSCHAPGGSQSGKSLDTYAGVSRLSSDIEPQVAGCAMPPGGSTQPTAAERDTILAWIACGAQNN